MNYEEMKAQFEGGSTPSTAGKPSNSTSGHSQEEIRAQHRRKTPLDSIIQLIPFALIFLGALAGGTWYLQDPEGAQNQFNQLMGNVVQGVDDESPDPEPAENEANISTEPVANPIKQELSQN